MITSKPHTRRPTRLAAIALCAWAGWVALHPVRAAPDPESLVRPALSAAVWLDGNYFSADGRRFLPLGVHWVPAKSGLQWPLSWDPHEIEADFAKMAAMGFNTVRLDLFWAWFEPRPGDYNPEAFAQLDFLIALAHRYRLYLNPTLFVGGEVGEAYWDVPWRHGRNPHSDPEMLRLQTNLAREFGRRYAHETAILAWDLTDEPPFWISSGTTDAMAINWTRLIAQGIRRYDTLHPIVVGVSTEDVDHGPFRPDNIAGDVDFLSVHPYTIYKPELFPDPMVSERGTYGAAFETTLSRDAGRPVLVQELGASAAQYSTEKVVAYERVAMYSALGAGANGLLLWCFTDAAPDQYRKVPYLRSPHETQFGLTSWDRKTHPQGTSFQEFIQSATKMRLDEIAVSPRDLGIVIPEEWARVAGDFSHFGLTGPETIPYVSVSEGSAVNGQTPKPYEGNQSLMSSLLAAFILAHEAGMTPALPRESGDWKQYPLLMLPFPTTATEPVSVHVHTDFWEKARRYVAGGGALYASLAASSAIPEMASLFGARMTDGVPLGDVTLTVVNPLGDLKVGETFSFKNSSTSPGQWGTGLELAGGTVIAVDQDQRPALVSFTVGKGKTLLSAYPLELYLGAQPLAFERVPSNYRLIRALRDWAGIHPLVTTDQPLVEASAVSGRAHGYFILANHSGETLDTHLTSSLPVNSIRRLTPTGTEGIQGTSRDWSLALPPYGGAILEWQRK